MLILLNKAHEYWNRDELPFHEDLQIDQQLNKIDEIRFKYPKKDKGIMTNECYIRTPDGKNLFDKDMAVQFSYLKYTDGGMYDAAEALLPDTWYASDFIRVEPWTTYIIRATGDNEFDNGMAFYDAQKSYLSGYSMMEATSPAISFTTPLTCHFMRFGFNVSQPTASPCTLDKVQLELGSEPTAYEPYVERNEFVIKEINPVDDYFVEIIGEQNVEAFKGSPVEQFINYTTPPLAMSQCKETIESAIGAQTNAWTLAEKTNLLSKARKIDIKYKSLFEVLTELADTYYLELRFDPVNLIVTPFMPGHNTPINRGAYLAEQLNLDSIKVRQTTSEYCTKLIPIGTDANDNPLSIASCDNSTFHDFGDNFIYDKPQTWSEKVLAKFTENSTAKTAQALLDDAESEFLQYISPRKSYSAELIELFDQTDYKFMMSRIGDEIGVLHDDKEKLRIVKYTRFFDSMNKVIPDQSVMEINSMKETLITILAGR